MDMLRAPTIIILCFIASVLWMHLFKVAAITSCNKSHHWHNRTGTIASYLPFQSISRGTGGPSPYRAEHYHSHHRVAVLHEFVSAQYAADKKYRRSQLDLSCSKISAIRVMPKTVQPP
ncbi:hypothetical protein BJ742DRAFT_476941 [Cladochytrium replicatum]|nr:hypothetical protein BJ742DRAFT_476941 [Cladochytrium replicatum]